MKKLWQWIKCHSWIHWTYSYTNSGGDYRYCQHCGKYEYYDEQVGDWV